MYGYVWWKVIGHSAPVILLIDRSIDQSKTIISQPMVLLAGDDIECMCVCVCVRFSLPCFFLLLLVLLLATVYLYSSLAEYLFYYKKKTAAAATTATTTEEEEPMGEWVSEWMNEWMPDCISIRRCMCDGKEGRERDPISFSFIFGMCSRADLMRKKYEHEVMMNEQ